MPYAAFGTSGSVNRLVRECGSTNSGWVTTLPVSVMNETLIVAGVVPGFSMSSHVSKPPRLAPAARYQVLPGVDVASVSWPPWPLSKYIARSTTMGWSAVTCVANPEVVNSAFTNTDLRPMAATNSVRSTTDPSSRKKRNWTSEGTGFGLRSNTHVSNGGTVEPSARYHTFDV